MKLANNAVMEIGVALVFEVDNSKRNSVVLCVLKSVQEYYSACGSNTTERQQLRSLTYMGTAEEWENNKNKYENRSHD